MRNIDSRRTPVPNVDITGKNRFKNPIPKAPFLSTFDATKNPMACFPSHLGGEIKYGKYVNFSEDCLNLNVFVPHTFEKNVSMPVMIWIHGGSFVEGATAIFQGEGIIAFGDVIVVTVSYRLGMFGYIQSADGKLPGNLGLWDQHLGIKWVHDNIVAFTENPNDVNIFGESAGGESVIFQSLYPGNRGFFQRVIAQSGSALAYWAVHATPNAEPLIANKGCERAPDPVTCLRALTPWQLQDDDTSAWQPVIDRDFLLARGRHQTKESQHNLNNGEYTDWLRPNDSAITNFVLLFSLTNMSNDVSFFLPSRVYGERARGT
ncbi:hypothetical protein DPMN_055712 [Dreissena polymorpha]|uniref:Carboxylesterase type B domain-containing protein n=1 Tax=Dreissena polymorpha TaxID=45954 RepID=A0A9D4CS41_DREPO|nr:hypothetical protein DPMN_055712 [Dreissena polymorpha]